MRLSPAWRIGGTAAWLAAGVTVSLGILVWYGYTALGQWKRSEEMLADRRARETAELLLTAVTRDMRGAQYSVLSEWWDQLSDAPADETRNTIAGAFARYPYPESFFVWLRGDPTPATVFFNRLDRLPNWLTVPRQANLFPVILGTDATVSNAIQARLREEARVGRRYAAVPLDLQGRPYQVIARLFYRDAYREDLEGIVGFTVDLDWVRAHYFPEVARQVARIGPGAPFAIVDGAGRTVAGPARVERSAATVKRWFPLLFIDPLLVGVDSPADLSQEFWAVQVGVGDDSGLGSALAAANRTFLLGTVAAISLSLGLLLTVRAARAHARVASMRSDFVSTVTHELKSPIATIRAAGETLARGRVAGAEAQRDYAQMVVQESKRLGRLVENLLAYARVTDVTEVYACEAVDLAELAGDVLRGYRTQIEAGGFDAGIDGEPDVPAARGDRTALTLMLDNLVDNALRYAGEQRWLRIELRPEAANRVSVRVADRGIGIPASEVAHVTKKFFRGRTAKPGGSGLGLAIVNRIVQDHGGTLAVQSEPGQGTRVTVTLPAAE